MMMVRLPRDGEVIGLAAPDAVEHGVPGSRSPPPRHTWQASTNSPRCSAGRWWMLAGAVLFLHLVVRCSSCSSTVLTRMQPQAAPAPPRRAGRFALSLFSRSLSSVVLTRGFTRFLKLFYASRVRRMTRFCPATKAVSKQSWADCEKINAVCRQKDRSERCAALTENSL